VAGQNSDAASASECYTYYDGCCRLFSSRGIVQCCSATAKQPVWERLSEWWLLQPGALFCLPSHQVGVRGHSGLLWERAKIKSRAHEVKLHLRGIAAQGRRENRKLCVDCRILSCTSILACVADAAGNWKNKQNRGIESCMDSCMSGNVMLAHKLPGEPLCHTHSKLL
jgi:hypothetical protein